MSVSAAASLKAVSKSFGATKALKDVSLSFHAGEVHCLLGENGAGKSTAVKILSGLFGPDGGEVWIGGEQVSRLDVSTARSLGVAMVFQELSLAPHLSVWENILLGTEPRMLGFTRMDAERAKCRELLDRYQIDIDADTKVDELTASDQQLVEIMKAMARSPSVLILDEPTAMLGVREKRILFEVVRRARLEGKAIILVTHHVDEVIELGDRVSLLRDGRLLETYPVGAHVDRDAVIRRLAGGSAETSGKRSARPADTVLLIEGVPHARGGPVGITLNRGEIVGVYGVVGCGRERVVAAAVGLDRSLGLDVFLDGRPHAVSTPAHALARGVAFLPSGRTANLVFPTLSILENLTLSWLRQFAARLFVPRSKEKHWGAEQIRLGLVKVNDVRDSILSLSGGNQQKVMLARVLSNNASVVVLEEPTAGVDIETKRQIHKSLLERTESTGVAILLISSDLNETLDLCDRVYAMYNGEITGHWDAPSRADESGIIAAVLGSARQDQGALRNAERSP